MTIKIAALLGAVLSATPALPQSLLHKTILPMSHGGKPSMNATA
jgi:hypothetical protein